MRKSSLRVVAAAFALACFCAAAHAKDRALLVGIDVYENPRFKARGCVNDTILLRDFLTSKLKFDKDDIHVLKNSEATADAIREEVRNWLVKDTRPGDRVFFAYAGHGTRVPDEPNGDEVQDKMDEALAVYDVEPRLPIIRGAPVIPARGYITDDEVSRWIGDLHGRQVVMLFDSCHSGTISRGVSGGSAAPSRFLRFSDDEDSEGTRAVYSPDYDKPTSRDMGEYTEGFLKTAVEGVVVISAARADQEAFPIDASKYKRMQGALTYLFVEKQQDGLIPVGGMQDALNEGMEELKRAGLLARGRNGQYQSPQVEIYSQGLAALPIFGGMGVASWTLAPQIALHNSLSKTEVKIWTGDGRNDYSITKSIRSRGQGETIPLLVRTSRPGYLYIWVFSRGEHGDVASCLFPSKFEEDNAVKAGTISFPRCRDGKQTCEEKDRYEFYAVEPEGSDVWVALVTDEKLDLRDSGHVYSWADAFDRIGLEKVQEALSKYVTQATTRGGAVGLTVRPTVADWQADTLVLKTHM
jgi:hypothetical protein